VPHRFVATCTRGAEAVLADELHEFGINATPDNGAVRFMGSLELGYRACLWSRVASRVLVVLDRFWCPHADALYEGIANVPWGDHFLRGTTFAVTFVGHSQTLRHSQFSARRTKDAVVDRLRHDRGQRPDVDLRNPDLRVHVHLRNDRAIVSIDLAGVPLHERGGQRQAEAAPLKENLAAACLRLAGWPAIAARGGPFVDPMCGSGTLVSEAAGMALNLAPGLLRRRWGFLGWAGHRPANWRKLIRQAEERVRDDISGPVAFGSDADPAVIAKARLNLTALHVDHAASVVVKGLDDVRPPRRALTDAPRGLVLVNPPYGARLGDVDSLKPLYARLGDGLRRQFMGWHAAVLTGSKPLAQSIGLRPSRRHPLFNGRIDCRLLEFPISDKAPTSDHRAPGWRDREETEQAPAGGVAGEE